MILQLLRKKKMGGGSIKFHLLKKLQLLKQAWDTPFILFFFCISLRQINKLPRSKLRGIVGNILDDTVKQLYLSSIHLGVSPALILNV